MRSEVRNVTPSNGLAWSAMRDIAYPLERPGGGLFFRRGDPCGRAGALRNHRQVCVSEGAPRAHAGAPGSKISDFSLNSLTP